MRRVTSRWRTTFGKWIESQGVDRVARGVGVTTQAVYAWLSGAASPNYERRLALVRLSKGALTEQDISEHRVRMGGSETCGSI